MTEKINYAIFYKDYLYIIEFENGSTYLHICVNTYAPICKEDKHTSAYFLNTESYKIVCYEIWLDYKYQKPIENWLNEKMCNIFIKTFGV
jgi:hypothetical protein